MGVSMSCAGCRGEGGPSLGGGLGKRNLPLSIMPAELVWLVGGNPRTWWLQLSPSRTCTRQPEQLR